MCDYCHHPIANNVLITIEFIANTIHVIETHSPTTHDTCVHQNHNIIGALENLEIRCVKWLGKIYMFMNCSSNMAWIIEPVVASYEEYCKKEHTLCL